MLGSDPEFCGFDFNNNKAVSLIGLIGGSKHEPKKIEVEGCFIQEDNVNCEFTVPPKKDFIELIGVIKECVDYTDNKLKGLGYKLVANSSARYDEKELDNEVARTFGCDPSFCVYTNGVTVLPEVEAIGNLRCSGFHIHFGWNNTYTEEAYKNFILLCDLFLGVPSLVYDKDEDRRLIYGCLGDYRLPSYGVEYRTMGSGMYNNYKVINLGINMIKTVLNLNAVQHFCDHMMEDLYRLFNEKEINYKSKHKVWEKASSLYTEL